MKRCLSLLTLVIIAIGLWVLTANAQEKFPNRPIDFIVPWGVGGGADQFARTAAPLLEKILSVPVAVSNVPGATGNTGNARLQAARADGHTIAIYIADTAATVSMGTSPYKVDDFEWVVRMQVAPSFFFVRGDDKRFKTFQDLADHTKKNPDKLKVAITGIGSVDDVTVRYFATKQIRMTVVPYPKPGERYAAVIGGHEDVLYEQAGDVAQYLEAKQLRPIVVFRDKRLPEFPDVPAAGELGYDIRLPQWRSIVVKKGTPPDRIKSLADAFRKVSERPEWKKFAKAQYLDPESFMGPDEFGKWVRKEIEVMTSLMKQFGITK
jgi:tripartite-type tricarboxylate transporter receptor subunit TctC